MFSSCEYLGCKEDYADSLTLLGGLRVRLCPKHSRDWDAMVTSSDAWPRYDDACREHYVAKESFRRGLISPDEFRAVDKAHAKAKAAVRALSVAWVKDHCEKPAAPEAE